MIRFWKIVLPVVAILFLTGIVLAGAGWLTGASPDRIAELLYGGWDVLRGIFDAVRTEVLQLF